MNSNGHKERPILFSGEMVRAILEGRKTQTRRVIIPQPSDSWMHNPNTDWSAYYKRGRFGLKKHLWIMHPTENKEIGCPYGAPGDRLWVRETYVPSVNEDGEVLKNDPPTYRADNPVFAEGGPVGWSWVPPIFMPRWASRITLEITNVRVEQLWDIAEVDAQYEGIVANEKILDSHRMAFKEGWDSLNAKRGYGWEKNPWVWVIEFKVL